jgi:DNA-binding transcriptional LysR family regulator
MIALDRLRIFHAVAQSGSFTRAAEMVHLTQPGISKHIKSMEEYFGVPLFDRAGRKATLTQAGEVLLESTQEVLALVASAEQRIQDLRGLRGGTLRLGGSFPVGLHVLPQVLAAYRKRYPQVKVELAIANSAGIEARILDDKLDLGLVSHDVQHPKLVTHEFMRDELVVIVPPDHRWSSKRRVKAQELVSESMILSGKGAGARAVVEERLQAKGIVLENVLDFANAEGVKHAVEAGLGISIQPRVTVQQEIDAGLLRGLRLADMECSIPYMYIVRKGRHVSNAQQAFVELLPKMNRRG